jgi:hypothetical protein
VPGSAKAVVDDVDRRLGFWAMEDSGAGLTCRGLALDSHAAGKHFIGMAEG